MKITFDDMCIGSCSIKTNAIKESNLNFLKNYFLMLKKEEQQEFIEFLKENKMIQEDFMDKLIKYNPPISYQKR